MPMTVYLFLLFQLLIVSWLDLKHKKIFNSWSLLNLIIFIFIIFFYPTFYPLSWHYLYIPLGWIVVGIVLFALKIMGAGDSKYLFTMFLLIPEQYQVVELLCLLYVTIFVGGGLLLYNSIRSFDKIILAWQLKDLRYLKEAYGHRFSFAPVIGVSWIWFGLVLMNIAKI